MTLGDSLLTNSIELAIEDLKRKNITVNMETATYREDKLISVYLTPDFGGFAVHLLERIILKEGNKDEV